MALLRVVHSPEILAQASSRTAADSATLDKAHAFAARLRTLLDSQSVAGLADLMVAPSTSPHRGDPTLIRFLGPAQILSSGAGQVFGATTGLSVTVVSQDLLVLTGVDDAHRRAHAGGPRVWTALVNVREKVPRLLYLHVSPAR